MPARRIIFEVASCAASVSVGKPAMMSAPKTMSGRRRRASSQKRTTSRARWRRFICFSTRSSPCWADRCRCGISLSSSANTSINLASGSAGSTDDRRNRCRPLTRASRACTRSPSLGRPGKSDPQEVMSTPVSTISTLPPSTSLCAESMI